MIGTNSGVTCDQKQLCAGAQLAAAVGCGQGTVPSFGQCGGSGFKGSHKCGVDGEACIQKNDFYSQCLNTSKRGIPPYWKGSIVYCGAAPSL